MPEFEGHVGCDAQRITHSSDKNGVSFEEKVDNRLDGGGVDLCSSICQLCRFTRKYEAE